VHALKQEVIKRNGKIALLEMELQRLQQQQQQ
jgi:hypothetical protein